MNKTKLILYIGFSGVLALLLSMMLLSFYQTYRAQERIEAVVLDQNTKLHLLTEMRTLARERTVSLEKMIIFDDVIDISEEWERFYNLGSMFIVARTAFLSMELTENEKAVIAKQRTLVRDNSLLQVEVTELILEGSDIEARDLLLNKVMPIQDQVFIFMTEMMDLQRSAAKLAVENANAEYRTTIILLIFLSLLAAAASMIVMRKIIRAITDAEHQLYVEKERAQITLQSIGDAVIATDVNGIIVHANDSSVELLRKDIEHIIGHHFNDVVNIRNEKYPAARNRLIDTVLEEGHMIKSVSDCMLLHDNGESCHVEFSAAPIQAKMTGKIQYENKASTKDPLGIVISMRDVSHVRQLTKELAYHASYDVLTGLLNRREFLLSLDSVMKSVQSDENEMTWLCFMDLDRFKGINDSCGHQAGDDVLRLVSDLLMKCTRQTDYVGRLGGDEFCLILRYLDKKNVDIITERIRKEINQINFEWDGIVFPVGASIGVVQITGTEKNTKTLLDKADMACYEAKRLGRNQVQVSEN